MKRKIFWFPVMGLVIGTAAERIASGQAEIDGRPATMNTSETRSVIINDVRLSDEQVVALERRFRIPMRDGNYWYDRRGGACGLKGGPTAGSTLPGLDVGGPLKANASNGNTGVFVNGRELHIMDVVVLRQFVPVYSGRYWCDAYGNGGFEGGPALWNVWQLIRAAGGGGNSGGAWGHYSKYGGSIVGDASGNYYQNKDIVWPP